MTTSLTALFILAQGIATLGIRPRDKPPLIPRFWPLPPFCYESRLATGAWLCFNQDVPKNIEHFAMSKIILSLSILIACIISASAQNTISFDNQSGEPALVKLIGPISSNIEVPDATKQAVQASAGKYFIKVRYGVQGKYHYTKGQEFTVDETATTTSKITITLHKVVNGNYDSSPITEQEFSAGNPTNARTNGDAAATTSLGSTSAEERVKVIRQLTDQSVLAKIALEDKDFKVREAAFDSLTDQSLLVKLITNESLPLQARHMAIAKLGGANVGFTKQRGALGWTSGDAIESMGRMRHALADPIIASRMPNVTLDANVESVYASYSGGHKPGERVTFTLKRGSEALVTQQWTTAFHSSTFTLDFQPADVNISGMMAKFFSVADLSQDDLVKLSQSEVPEIRAGAVENLSDQTLLAKIAANDKVWAVRRATVVKLTDQAVLAKIAVEEKDDSIRADAIAKLADQELLAKLAVGGTDWKAKQSAFNKLTDQSLAEIAVGSKYQDDMYQGLRDMAVIRLRDETLLANIAVQDKDSGVRSDAKKRLNELRASKP